MFDVNDETNGRPRRVEVLSGPERRRRWSLEDKARIVAEAFAPDTNASAVARRWQICPQQVYAWRREARAGLLARPAKASAPPAFVPIVSGVVGRTGPRHAPPCASALEIEFAGGVLRVPGDDPDLLVAVLRAVRASVSLS